MNELYLKTSLDISRVITKMYSTSFYSAVSLLHPSIRGDIHAIYGFVRLADEVVDSFSDYPQSKLLDELESELNKGLSRGISTNPVVNSFIHVVKKCNIEHELISAFIYSMRRDLTQHQWLSDSDINRYIYGSAQVVGLMCLRVFTQQNPQIYDKLKGSALALGAAFQRVNFLRDLRSDYLELNREYFPQFSNNNFTESAKSEIIKQIESEFKCAYKGIVQLPQSSRLGVYIAYSYYMELLNIIKRSPIERLINSRVRVNNPHKIYILIKCIMHQQNYIKA